jgi:hypothetical protein
MNTSMTTRHLTTILAAAAATFAASLSIAQTAPTSSKPAAGTEVQSPYWNTGNGDTYYMEQPQYGEGLLEKAVLVVPAARADAVVAKWQFRRANTKLNNNADMIRRDFNESDEYGAALGELKAAYRNLENARFEALKGLRGTDEFAAIESLRKSVSGQIADERDQDEPSLERLVALAELKMQSIAPVRAAEQEAIENSSAVRDAKARLVDASNKLAKLEREFAHDVRDSIELADARKAKEDARIAMLASAAFLDEARIARNIAIRYSYASRGLINVGTYGNGYRTYSDYFNSYGYPYYGGGQVEYGLGGLGGGQVGVTGSTGFGRGSNAFFGPSGNAFIGGGPGSNPAAQHPGGNRPGANSPGMPFGPNPGKDIPSPFGK